MPTRKCSMSCYDLAEVCFANQKLSCAYILLGLGLLLSAMQMVPLLEFY
jgi:hypothetical protein